MSRYADYEGNGEIFCIVEGEPGAIDTAHLIEVGEDVSDETHYIDMSQPIFFARRRHVFDTSYAVNDLSVSFRNLPPGTTVGVSGSELIVEDAVAEIEFDVPGTYTIELTHFQYMDKTLEVTLE